MTHEFKHGIHYWPECLTSMSAGGGSPSATNFSPPRKQDDLLAWIKMLPDNPSEIELREVSHALQILADEKQKLNPIIDVRQEIAKIKTRLDALEAAR